MGTAVHGEGNVKTDENTFFPDETFLAVFPHIYIVYVYTTILLLLLCSDKENLRKENKKKSQNVLQR